MDVTSPVPTADPLEPPEPPPPSTFPPDKPEEPVKKPSRLLVPLLLVFIICAGTLGYILIKVTSKPQTQITRTPAPTPAPLSLAITSPDANATLVDGEVLVSGRTLPNTTVLIYSDSDETSLESDITGRFESSVLVDENGGPLTVTVFRENGEEKTETLILGKTGATSYLGPDVLGKTTAPGQVKKETQVTTVKAESSSSRASKTIQPMPTIKPGNGASPVQLSNIKKINTFLTEVKENPKHEKLGADKLKQLLRKEASGTATLRNALKLEKMSIREATPATQLKRHAVMGVITAISGGVITISHQIQQTRTWTLYVNELTVVSMKGASDATIASLTVGMRVAAVGELVDNGILAKHIHVIPGLAKGVLDRFRIATEGGGIATPSPVASVTATPVLTVTPESSPTATQTVAPTP